MGKEGGPGGGGDGEGERGRWVTEQLLTNVALTPEEAGGVRNGAGGVQDGAPPPDPGGAPDLGGPPDPPRTEPPSVRTPAVGGPERREVGGSYREEELLKKNLLHPPPETQPEPTPELLSAERVLLSLRATSHELHLGVREARQLAEAAAEWLRRGVSAAELRRALTAGLPPAGVRSAIGFLRHRLTVKLPAEAVAVVADSVTSAAAAGLVVCRGPGDEHVFRPVGGRNAVPPVPDRGRGPGGGSGGSGGSGHALAGAGGGGERLSPVTVWPCRKPPPYLSSTCRTPRWRSPTGPPRPSV